MKRIIKVWIRFGLGAIAVVLAINVGILIYADPYLLHDNWLPPTKYGMILGASVFRDGSLSDVLRDRVDTALEVYQQWWFEYFFVSWDDSDGHGEIRSIVAYLHKQWIDDQYIVTDGAGFDTYDSMRRAKRLYQVDSMLIFTQAFHLSRSVYTARRLQIHAYGIVTDRQPYLRATRFAFREAWARVKAFLDVEILHSSPRNSQ